MTGIFNDYTITPQSLNQYNAFRGVVDYTQIGQFDQYETGYQFLAVLGMPAFITKFADSDANFKNIADGFKHMLEYEFKGMDGLPDITSDQMEITDGINSIRMINKVNMDTAITVSLSVIHAICPVVFVSVSAYSVANSESSPIENQPHYGHKLDNEFFMHYFVDIRNDTLSYISLINEFDNENIYFNAVDNNISLKDYYKNLLTPYFDEKDDLSEEGQSAFSKLTEDIFLNLYARMMEDIYAKNLTYNGMDFNENRSIVTNFDKIYYQFFSICALIAYFLSWAICYILVPLANKSHRTLTMIIMKVEHIGKNNLYLLRPGEVLLNSVYQLVANFAYVLFLPLSYISITYLLSLPWLPALFAISFVFNFVSFFFIIFNQYNRGVSDLLSRSLLISSSDLDAIYRSKGYNV